MNQADSPTPTTESGSVPAPTPTTPAKRREEALHVAILILSFAALVPLWFAFEHRLPCIDESGHILNSLTYTDLLTHPRILRGQWWHHMVTVNRFYPPFTHIFNGAMRAIFGQSRWVDVASLTFFNIVLTSSVYISTRTLTRHTRPALFAATIVNLYPEIALLNRCYWLDFPLIAMCSAALCSLIWWRDNPTWRRAILSGIAIGLACATKQIAVAYLALPGVFCFLEKIVQFRKTKETKPIAQLVIVAIITALLVGPWLITNYHEAQATAAECAKHLGDNKLTFIGNLRYYGQCLPAALSPLLLISFLGAIVLLGRSAFTQLLLVCLAGMGGLLAVSTLQWIFPKPQYLAPAFADIAIITGVFFAQLQSKQWRPVKVIPVVVIAAAILQLISLEFAPYPIEHPLLLRDLASLMGNTINEPRLNMQRVAPHEKEETGQTWVIETIDGLEKGRKVWLNVLSDSPQLNVHTLELIALKKKSSVKPTTSLNYSIAGNTVNFSPETALYYEWYLIPSNLEGLGFENERSHHQYDQLVRFVQESGHFKFMDKKQLSDGTYLMLFSRVRP